MVASRARVTLRALGRDLVFTKLSHFQHAWEFEIEGTLKKLRALTDASLAQAVTPQERTLGRLAWHITTTLREMMGRTGLKLAGPEEHAPLPATAAAIVAGYETASASLLHAGRTSRPASRSTVMTASAGCSRRCRGAATEEFSIPG